MKVAIITPASEFSKKQKTMLDSVGEIRYTTNRETLSFESLLELCEGSELLAIEPDLLGGFEVAPIILQKLLDKLPQIRGLALGTTAFEYVSQKYCEEKGILVSNIPHYTSESIAEHAIALLLGCSKNIFLLDHRTIKNLYKEKIGHEVLGKTFGIIGLGNIGTRTAELGRALGMKTIGWNRTHKNIEGVTLEDLDVVLSTSDYISLHLSQNEETTNFFSKSKISMLKKGVIIINTANRELVDEAAMADGIKSGIIDSYAVEVEDVNSGPLKDVENAFLFKSFGWYTQEVLDRRTEIWVNNIIGLAQGKPLNLIFTTT